MPFQAHANIKLSDPDKVIEDVCAHLLEHDAEIEERADGKVVHLRETVARIAFGNTAARIDISSPTLEGLYFMRMEIASHIREFASDRTLDIRWNGDGEDLAHPPNFRILNVAGVSDITPHMRRITFSGEDVGRYAGLDALHVNLVIPYPDGPADQWPRIGADGLLSWPTLTAPPAHRKYTVRKVDTRTGTIDIDFVLHDNAGPGAGFALRTRAGDRIGMFGPGGGGLVKADWYLFAGDETALPAIARMLEHLPKTARGKAIIEVANACEIQPLSTNAAIEIEWLCRDDCHGNLQKTLPSCVKAVPFPGSGTRIYAWAGCEYDDFRTIRAYLRQEHGLSKHEQLTVSYWRRGKGEE